MNNEEESETVDYIVAKMREPSIYTGRVPVKRVDADFRWFADRIEAAHKREIAALEADRDQWRKQALKEDARANAETQKPLRNCDKYTNFQDAWYAWTITIIKKDGCLNVWTEFVKWLFEPVEEGGAE